MSSTAAGHNRRSQFILNQAHPATVPTQQLTRGNSGRRHAFTDFWMAPTTTFADEVYCIANRIRNMTEYAGIEIHRQSVKLERYMRGMKREIEA